MKINHRVRTIWSGNRKGRCNMDVRRFIKFVENLKKGNKNKEVWEGIGGIGEIGRE